MVPVHAYRADLYRAALGVVRGVDDLLEVERYHDSLRYTPVVVRLQNLFQTILQPAVADDEAEAPGGQVIAMRTGYSIEDPSQADPVVWPAPAAPAHDKTGTCRPVDLGKGPRLGVAVVPTQPAEEAEVVSDLLVDAHADAVLVAIGARLRDIGVDGHQLQRLVVIAHVRMIQKDHESGLSGAAVDLIAFFQLGDLPLRFQEVPIEGSAVRDCRLREQAISQRPVLRGVVAACAVGVSADVGGVVPGAVVHQGPVEELGARIVGVAVVVHHVGGRKFADGDGQPPHVALASDLVDVVRCPLPPAAAAESLTQKQPRDIRRGVLDADARRFAIGKTGDAGRSAEAGATCGFGIEYELSVVSFGFAQPGCKKHRAGHRVGSRLHRLQAFRAGVGRREDVVHLGHDGCLRMRAIPGGSRRCHSFQRRNGALALGGGIAAQTGVASSPAHVHGRPAPWAALALGGGIAAHASVAFLLADVARRGSLAETLTRKQLRDRRGQQIDAGACDLAIDQSSAAEGSARAGASLGGVRSRARAIPSRWARWAGGAILPGWLRARGWSRSLRRNLSLAFGGRIAAQTDVAPSLTDVQGGPALREWFIETIPIRPQRLADCVRRRTRLWTGTSVLRLRLLGPIRLTRASRGRTLTRGP